MKKKKPKRTVEVFLDPETTPQSLFTILQEQSCSECEVTVLDIKNPRILDRAEILNIYTFPAVVMNGKPLARCNKKCPAGDALRELV